MANTARRSPKLINPHWSRLRLARVFVLELLVVLAVLGLLGFGVAAFKAIFEVQEEDDWGNISKLAFAADGHTLVGDEFVYVGKTAQTELYGWERATGETLWKAVLPGLDSASVLMPDGQTLVTLCDLKATNARYPTDPARPKSYTLQFREVRTGRLLGQSAPLATRANFASLDVSASGSRVAVLLDDGVKVWEAPQTPGKDRIALGRWRSVLSASAVKRLGYLKRAQFAMDEQHLLIKTESSARLWNIQTGKRVHSFDGSAEVVLSPDRRLVAILKAATNSTAVSELRLVDLSTWRVVSERRESGWPTDSLQAADKLRFLPPNIPGLDGSTVAISFLLDPALLNGSSENVAAKTKRIACMDLCWNVSSNTLTRKMFPQYSPLDALAFSPDGRFAAGAFSDYDNKLGYIRDLQTGEETILRGHRFR